MKPSDPTPILGRRRNHVRERGCAPAVCYGSVPPVYTGLHEQRIQAEAERVARECPPNQRGGADAGRKQQRNRLQPGARKRMALAVLAEHGPLAPGRLAVLLGLSGSASLGSIMYSPWFVRQGRPRSPHMRWALSPAGWRAYHASAGKAGAS